MPHAVTYSDIFKSDSATKDLNIQYADHMVVDKDHFYIDIEAIIRENGINIEYKPLDDDQTGYFDKTTHTIVVNQDHDNNQQRMTLTHHFAHHTLLEKRNFTWD